MDALQAGIYPMDFVQRYFASFYCVACTLMGNRQIIYTVSMLLLLNWEEVALL